MYDLPPPPPKEIAFILYSTTEARAMRPVIEILNDSGLTTAVIAFGAARKELADIPLESLPKELLSVGENGCWSAKEKPLDSIPEKIALIGLGSRFQIETAKKLHERGVRLIGFYDSFESLKTHAFAKEAIPYLANLLVPTKSQGYTPVGNHEVDILLSKPKAPCPFPKKRPVLLYTGGYGPIYEAGFALFAQALKSGLDQKYAVWIAEHPAPFVDMTWERKLLDGLEVTFIPKGYPTHLLYPYAERVLTCTSSTLMHALALGRPSAHLTDSSFSTVAIEKGWAPKLTSSEALLEWLEEEPEHRFDLRAEVPENCAQRTASYLFSEAKLAKKSVQ